MIVILIIAVGAQSIRSEVTGVTESAFTVQVGLQFFRHGRGDDLTRRRRESHCAMWMKDCGQWSSNMGRELASPVANWCQLVPTVYSNETMSSSISGS